MQATGSFHYHVIVTLAHIAEYTVHDAKGFDAANTVLYTDTLFGDQSVLLFLFCG